MTHSKFKIQNSKFSLPRYEPFTAKPGFFFAKDVGDSMNCRILNDCWQYPQFSISPTSTQIATPKESHGEGGNVEIRHLTRMANGSGRLTLVGGFYPPQKTIK